MTRSRRCATARPRLPARRAPYPTRAALGCIVVGLSAVAAMAGCDKSGSSPAAAKAAPRASEASVVEAATIGRGALTMVGDYIGEVRSDQSAAISADVPGRVVAIDIRLGDRVDAGATLARIDDVPARQQLRAAQSDLQRANARLRAVRVGRDNLIADERRKRPLAAKELISAREMEELEARVATARQEVAVAEAEVGGAEGRLATARETLRRTTVVAPFGGRIEARLAEVGTWVQPGLPLLRLVRDCDLYLRVTVPEQEAIRLRLGMVAAVRLNALPDRDLTGLVRRLAPALDPTTRTLDVDIALPGSACEGAEAEKAEKAEKADEAEKAEKADTAPAIVLRPGMVAHARVELGNASDAILVADQAVQLERDGSHYVWTIAVGKAVKRAISVGLRDVDRVEVTAGLAPGDVVILRGQDKLHDGVLVRQVGASMPAIAPPRAQTRAQRE